MEKFFDSIPDFLLGVIASIFAALIVMLFTWIFKSLKVSFSQSKTEKQNRLEKLKSCLNSPNVIDRIEGYFEILFNSLQYLILSVLLAIIGIIIPDNSIKSILFLLSIIPIFFCVREITRLYRIKQKDTIFYKFSVVDSLVIVRSEYGAKDRFIDVTPFIQEKVINNRIDVNINNALFGGKDPYELEPKELRTVYQIGRKADFKIVKENDNLIIP